MKTIKAIHIILLSVGLCFILAAPTFSALSTQSTSDISYINVDKAAAGTKLSGPLTIYYANSEFGATTDMYVFLRLRKGYQLYGFATFLEDVAYTVDGIADQQAALEEWIRTEVIPELYCPEGYRDEFNLFKEVCCERNSSYECIENTAVTYPPFAIKSTDQTVEDDLGYDFTTVPLYFTIMDVVIAVQD